MISILIPTRGRRAGLLRAVESARATADSPENLEFVVYIDDDDAQTYAGIDSSIRQVVGPRIVLSNMWNKCAAVATGEILGQGNDDIVWKTRRWDGMLTAEFAKFPDHIVMVHGNDGSRGFESSDGRFAPHPFVHRRWVEILGHFTGGFFSSDFGDSWINDLANAIGRRRYVPLTIEHQHFIFGKAQEDQTTRDRLARHSRDNVAQLYKDLDSLRQVDIEKLKATIHAGLATSHLSMTNQACPGPGNSHHRPTYSNAPLWEILILTQPSRQSYLSRLLAVLKPQVEHRPDVRVTTRLFDRTMDLGANRQAMIDASTAVYTNFLDDDDLVAQDYVDQIYPLMDGIDYIGHRLILFIDNVKQKPTTHSLRYKEWNADQDGYYRDISHLNPIRRELAKQVKMSGWHGEDMRWAEALRAKGIVKTEHFVDSVLYFYYFRSNKDDQEPQRFATARVVPANDPMAGHFFPLGHKRPECPRCKSTACGIAGGMRRCNQCGAAWI